MMDLLPVPQSGQLGVVIGPNYNQLLTLTAVLALNTPVRVVVGGNRFNAHQLAREIRRHTPHLHDTLARVTLARAFTCYQAVALLDACRPEVVRHTAVSTTPLLVIDLLATFTDESIPTPESYRLLRQALNHLQHIRTQAPVLVSIQPPPQPDRAGLLHIVTAAATRILHHDT